MIDLHSLYLVGWSLSKTIGAYTCARILEQAIDSHGSPKIVSTDQGSQFASEEFTEYVLSSEIRLSMDDKDRASDNNFIERLCRSVKYEHVYLKRSEDGIKCYR